MRCSVFPRTKSSHGRGSSQVRRGARHMITRYGAFRQPPRLERGHTDAARWPAQKMGDTSTHVHTVSFSFLCLPMRKRRLAPPSGVTPPVSTRIRSIPRVSAPKTGLERAVIQFHASKLWNPLEILVDELPIIPHSVAPTWMQKTGTSSWKQNAPMFWRDDGIAGSVSCMTDHLIKCGHDSQESLLELRAVCTPAKRLQSRNYFDSAGVVALLSKLTRTRIKRCHSCERAPRRWAEASPWHEASRRIFNSTLWQHPCSQALMEMSHLRLQNECHSRRKGRCIFSGITKIEHDEY